MNMMEWETAQTYDAAVIDCSMMKRVSARYSSSSGREGERGAIERFVRTLVVLAARDASLNKLRVAAT